MYLPNHFPLRFHGVLVVLLATLALNFSCSAPVPRPTGAAADYQDAKDMFQRGRFDRALEFSDGQASASPPTKFTERAQVLRVVIFTGQVKSYKECVDAYTKGAEKIKDPHYKAEYDRLRHDNMQAGINAALGLAETAHQLLEGGKISKELILEAPYPSIEGPLEVTDVGHVREGDWIEPDHQDRVAIDSMNKGIDDALADAVSGDRSKARNALASGSTTISGLDFALFTGNQLLEGANFFDRKYNDDPPRLKTMCDEAYGAVKAADALLKETPDKDKEIQVRKLEDQIKIALKRVYAGLNLKDSGRPSMGSILFFRASEAGEYRMSGWSDSRKRKQARRFQASASVTRVTSKG